MLELFGITDEMSGPPTLPKEGEPLARIDDSNLDVDVAEIDLPFAAEGDEAGEAMAQNSTGPLPRLDEMSSDPLQFTTEPLPVLTYEEPLPLVLPPDVSEVEARLDAIAAGMADTIPGLTPVPEEAPDELSPEALSDLPPKLDEDEDEPDPDDEPDDDEADDEPDDEAGAGEPTDDAVPILLETPVSSGRKNSAEAARERVTETLRTSPPPPVSTPLRNEWRGAHDDLGAVSGESDSGRPTIEAAPSRSAVEIAPDLRREATALGVPMEERSGRRRRIESDDDLVPERSRAGLYVVLGLFALVGAVVAWLVLGSRTPAGDEKAPSVATEKRDAAPATSASPDGAPRAAAGSERTPTPIEEPVKAPAPEVAPPVAKAPEPKPPTPSPEAPAPSPEVTPPAPSPAENYARLVKDAKAYLGRGRVSKAIPLLQQALALRPDAEAQDALIALANAALEQNDTDGALRFVERVIAVNPSNPDSYLVKGAVAQQLGKNGDARSAYEHYLRLAPRGRYASDVRHILESL